MTTIFIIFIIGYLLIITEQFTSLDKAVPALLMGVICWIVLFLQSDSSNLNEINNSLSHHLSSIAEIFIFLIGAMTIVELVDAHKGFAIIQGILSSDSKIKLIILISLITFFLSAVLDNLTTTIVMSSILRRVNLSKEDKLLFIGIVVIAANAGGAWSPIGDVTTTMLWIAKKISTERLIIATFMPSFISLVIPIFLIILFHPSMKKKIITTKEKSTLIESYAYSNAMLWCGIISLLAVPLLKSFIGIPPYMAMLLSLSCVWAISEYIDPQIFPSDEQSKSNLSIKSAMSRIEMSSILFFVGILLSIAAMEQSGGLHLIAQNLNHWIADTSILAICFGILSSVIDNVPLVAAAIGMYDMPSNDQFWIMLSYASGTGGSILIIGSAAGVAAMGLEKINFIEYFKKLSLIALIGFLSGALYLYFIH